MYLGSCQLGNACDEESQSDTLSVLLHYAIQLHNILPVLLRLFLLGESDLQWYPRGFFSSQVIVCSATLHSFDVKKLSEKIMHFPTWVDLKGEDSVPETVHHVVVPVNPKADKLWERLGKNHIRVSGL